MSSAATFLVAVCISVGRRVTTKAGRSFHVTYPVRQIRFRSQMATLRWSVTPLSTHQHPGEKPDSRPHPTNAAASVELQHLASGNADAFWRLWEEHEQYLYRICLHHLDGVQEEAEDALSILMVKLLDSMPRDAARIQNLRAWLTRITHNLCIDIRREIKRAQSLENIDELIAMDSEVLSASSETPEEIALRLEIGRHISHALDQLSLKLREPFLLHHLHDVPYNEIAARLEISPENARKRGQLARSILQETMEKYLSGAAKPFAKFDQPDLDAHLQKISPTSRAINETEVRLINVMLGSGVERSFCIHVDHRPRRLYPKIQQVMRYTMNHPGGWKKRLELAQLLYEAGKWKSAIQEYERVLEKQPRLLRVYLDLGNVFGLMDKAPDSIATYRKALQFINEPGSRHHLNGMIALRSGQYRTAAREFRDASKIEPDKVTHWNGLAMVHLLRDSPVEALGSLNQALKIDPRNSRALTPVPGLLRSLGRAREAERYVNGAWRRHSRNVLWIKALADSRSQRRLVVGAAGNKTRKLIEEALQLAPQSPEVLDSLSRFHLCRGEWPEGVIVLRRFIAQHRSCPEALDFYARALYRTGDPAAAARAIKRAHQLDPNSWKINLAACEILSVQAPNSELQILLETMLQKFSERFTIWGKVGLVVIKVFADADHACAISARGTELQPRLHHAWFQHSKVLTLAGRIREAIVAAEVGWRWLPEDEDGLLSVPAACRLARNSLLINDRAGAEFWIAEALGRVQLLITVDPAGGYFWQGKLLELSGDGAAALSAFRQAVKQHLFYPHRQEADDAIIRLASPLSRRARAFPVS